MIKRQCRGREIGQTLHIGFTKRRREHAARNPSGVKCRENGTECVRVIAVKCVVNFIQSSGFTPFKSLQSALTSSEKMSDVIVESLTRYEGMARETNEVVLPGQANE